MTVAPAAAKARAQAAPMPEAPPVISARRPLRASEGIGELRVVWCSMIISL
ncbi:MAG: hypothetical protein ACTHV8_02130 [Nesterenkonia sp.]